MRWTRWIAAVAAMGAIGSLAINARLLAADATSATDEDQRIRERLMQRYRKSIGNNADDSPSRRLRVTDAAPTNLRSTTEERKSTSTAPRASRFPSTVPTPAARQVETTPALKPPKQRVDTVLDEVPGVDRRNVVKTARGNVVREPKPARPKVTAKAATVKTPLESFGTTTTPEPMLTTMPIDISPPIDESTPASIEAPRTTPIEAAKSPPIAESKPSRFEPPPSTPALTRRDRLVAPAAPVMAKRDKPPLAPSAPTVRRDSKPGALSGSSQPPISVSSAKNAAPANGAVAASSGKGVGVRRSLRPVAGAGTEGQEKEIAHQAWLDRQRKQIESTQTPTIASRRQRPAAPPIPAAAQATTTPQPAKRAPAPKESIGLVEDDFKARKPTPPTSVQPQSLSPVAPVVNATRPAAAPANLASPSPITRVSATNVPAPAVISPAPVKSTPAPVATAGQVSKPVAPTFAAASQNKPTPVATPPVLAKPLAPSTTPTNKQAPPQSSLVFVAERARRAGLLDFSDSPAKMSPIGTPGVPSGSAAPVSPPKPIPVVGAPTGAAASTAKPATAPSSPSVAPPAPTFVAPPLSPSKTAVSGGAISALEKEKLAALDRERTSLHEKEKLAEAEKRKLADLNSGRIAQIEQEKLATIAKREQAERERLQVAALVKERQAALDRANNRATGTSPAMNNALGSIPATPASAPTVGAASASNHVAAKVTGGVSPSNSLTPTTNPKINPMRPADSTAYPPLGQPVQSVSVDPRTAAGGFDRAPESPRGVVAPRGISPHQTLGNPYATRPGTGPGGNLSAYDPGLAVHCVQILTRSTVDSDRWKAMQSLSTMRDWQATPHVAEGLRAVAMSDYNTYLRLHAVQMLGTLRSDPQVVAETLKVSAQFDSDPTIRATAAKLLDRMDTTQMATRRR